jgi:hypothetical protein
MLIKFPGLDVFLTSGTLLSATAAILYMVHVVFIGNFRLAEGTGLRRVRGFATLVRGQLIGRHLNSAVEAWSRDVSSGVMGFA